MKRGRSDALPLFVCLNDLGNQKPVPVIHFRKIRKIYCKDKQLSFIFQAYRGGIKNQSLVFLKLSNCYLFIKK